MTTIRIMSFSYQKGKPEGDWHIVDARQLPNPHGVADLRDLTGQDQKVQQWLLAQPATGRLMADLVISQEPAVAIGCYGGRHRSVAVAEMLASYYTKRGQDYTITHRELGMSRYAATKGSSGQ